MEIKTKNVKLAFESVGSQDENKSPIILLHSFASSKESWRNIMLPISVATGRKVYAYDTRNHGDSERSDNMNYSCQRDDLLHFMDSLHLKRAILIGHSMGGKTAMLFAQKWPERTELVIAEDISPKPVTLYEQQRALKYVKLLKTALTRIPNGTRDLVEAKNFVNNFLQEIINKDHKNSRPAAIDGSSLPLIKDKSGAYRWKTNFTPLEGMVTSYDSCFDYTNDKFMGPTLILYGTRSPYKVLEDKDLILRKFPHAELIPVEGAAHEIHSEYEDIFLKEVINFINKHTKTDPKKMKLEYEVFYPSGDKQRNAPPIIMLHGMVDSRKTWLGIAPNIAQNTGRIVYTVDARNHGDSPWTNEMNWEVLVDDIENFMEQHRIPKAIFIGHSMGGRTAFTLALRRPDMVEKLIVEDMPARTIRAKDGGLLAQLLELMKESLNAIPDGADKITAVRAITEFILSFIPQGEKSYLSSFDTKMIPLKKNGSVFTWEANLDALQQFLTTDNLHHDVSKRGVYCGDAIFLYGTKSIFKVHKDNLITKLFPRAVTFGFEGANHLIHHEYPEKFERIVCHFINDSIIMSKI